MCYAIVLFVLCGEMLQIRDGLLTEDSVLGKFCSTATPAPLQTTGPAAWIHFHSDFSVSDQGFHITYTTSPSKKLCILSKTVYILCYSRTHFDQRLGTFEKSEKVRNHCLMCFVFLFFLSHRELFWQTKNV